jgi:hypothetical protein
MRFTQKIAATCGLMTIAATSPLTVSATAANSVKTTSPFLLVSVHSTTLNTASVARADKISTRGAISADKKTLNFRQKSVRLVFHTGPETDMLSYRVSGLRNPTLVIPRGATIKALFVNNDGDMLHNVRFGVKPTSLSDGTALLKQSVGVAPLPHIGGSTLHGAEMVIKAPAQPGKYAYFCTVRGHAPGGMWGVIQVR